MKFWHYTVNPHSILDSRTFAMFSKKKVTDIQPRLIKVSVVDDNQKNGSKLKPDTATPSSLEIIYENVDATGDADDTSPNQEKSNGLSQRRGGKNDRTPYSNARASNRRKIGPANGKAHGFINAAYTPDNPAIHANVKRQQAPPGPTSSSTSSSLASSTSSNTSSATTDSGKSSSSDTTQKASSADAAWLRTMDSRFDSVTQGGQFLTLPQFKQALQVEESFFVDRFFCLIDKPGKGFIERQTMMEELRAITYGTQTEKIKFLFDIYNIKGTGKILKSEVREVLRHCIEESRIHVSAENLQAMTEAVLLAADKDRDGKISFEELRALVERHPTIAQNMAISSREEKEEAHKCCRHFSKSYLENNLKKVVFLLVYLLINLGLIILAVWLYWDQNHWTKAARANGMALNFNCTFILILVLRVTMTRLRNTPLVRIIPFDQHIMFHKICGYTILFQSILHTGANIGNAFAVSDDDNLEVWEILLTTKAGIGWVANSAYITGYILSIVLIVMIVLSLPFVRKSGYFEVFYWSHKLYLVFWAVLILHAGNFWKWFVVPGLIFVVEMIMRLKWVRSACMGNTYVNRVCLLPSGVTQLIITRPPEFTFKPGDYVFIQIPEIANNEWHPFTISSAPEERGVFWLHIRSVGHWTRSLHEYFSAYESVGGNQGAAEEVEEELKARRVKICRRASSIAWLKTKSVKARKINANIMNRVVTLDVKVQVHIDGPYGTPSRHILDAEHAILIGSGIGVTPFASILQSIVSQYKAKQVRCPGCSYSWCHETPSTVMNLKKVDFVWINRDQRHFEWFASLLSRLERQQEIEGGIGRILDMHMFMTSALPKTDMKGLGLQLALDLIHQKDKTDLITGLQTRTQAGRPNFDELFFKIRSGSNAKIKVFFCGSPLLGKVIKEYSHKYGFAFVHEYF